MNTVPNSLSSFFLNISELDEIQIKQMTRWIRDFDHSWSGNLNNFFYSIPFYFNERVKEEEKIDS